MAININKIADKTSTTPANSEETSGLPVEILEQPVFAGLLSGAPAALWVESGSKDPIAVLAVKNGKKLNDVGLFFDRSKEEGIDIVFNAQFLSPELVAAAKKKGRLKDIASPLSEVSAAINGTSAASEAGGATLASGMPSSVPVDGSLTTARKNNLEPGSPSEGPMPGSGRVLNSLMKPTI